MNLLNLKKHENEEEKVWLGQQIGRSTFLRRTFHIISNYLILRSWYIRKEINSWSRKAPKEVNILDSGSGFGQCAFYLSSINSKWNIYSLDINRDKVCLCNSFFNEIGRHNVIFKTVDIQEYKAEEAYDLILSIDVLNYIENEKIVLDNLYASLKTNGTLLISVPTNYANIDAFPIRSQKSTIQPVRKGYKKEELIELIKQSGFEIQHAIYTYGKAGKAAYNLSILYPLKMLELSKIFLLIIPFYLIIFLPISLLLNVYDLNVHQKTGEGLIVKAKKK